MGNRSSRGTAPAAGSGESSGQGRDAAAAPRVVDDAALTQRWMPPQWSLLRGSALSLDREAEVPSFNRRHRITNDGGAGTGTGSGDGEDDAVFVVAPRARSSSDPPHAAARRTPRIRPSAATTAAAPAAAVVSGRGDVRFSIPSLPSGDGTEDGQLRRDSSVRRLLARLEGRLPWGRARRPLVPKSHSTSTFSAAHTLADQDTVEALRAVAQAVQMMIVNAHHAPHVTLPDVFSEAVHPMVDPVATAAKGTPTRADVQRDPTQDDVYGLLAYLFHRVDLSAECSVVVLVYVERLVAATGLTLHRTNWRRTLLIATLLAAKAWEDEAVWNVDFCSQLPSFNIQDLNALELAALEMLRYNINVRASLYARYYFDLRTLARKGNRELGLRPLGDAGAARLEARSMRAERTSLARLRSFQSAADFGGQAAQAAAEVDAEDAAAAAHTGLGSIPEAEE